MLPWRIPTASFMVGTAWLVRGGGFRRTLIVPRGSLGGCRWKPGKRRPAGFTRTLSKGANPVTWCAIAAIVMPWRSLTEALEG